MHPRTSVRTGSHTTHPPRANAIRPHAPHARQRRRPLLLHTRFTPAPYHLRSRRHHTSAHACALSISSERAHPYFAHPLHLFVLPLHLFVLPLQHLRAPLEPRFGTTVPFGPFDNAAYVVPWRSPTPTRHSTRRHRSAARREDAATASGRPGPRITIVTRAHLQRQRRRPPPLLGERAVSAKRSRAPRSATRAQPLPTFDMSPRIPSLPPFVTAISLALPMRHRLRAGMQELRDLSSTRWAHAQRRLARRLPREG
ncbi:hypothetical protein DFH09DRAFT_41902 [Mycena vulgaris]|nr:hypothetical protein DFH09DRAFT_41902 [Mycena vulgaris]